MNHPDLDRLTAWVHGLVEPVEADGVERHVSECDACRERVAALRREAAVLERELAPSDRLAALKADLLRAAESPVPAPASRPVRGLLWQIPVAAAVLIGLFAALLAPGPRHNLVAGRVALEDGREVVAPHELAASESWRLRAVENATLRFSSRSSVELDSGARLGLTPGEGGAVQVRLTAGRAVFQVPVEARPLRLDSPAGRVEASDGKFAVRIVFEDEGETPMKGMLAGALVTVFAGSVSLSNPSGTAQAAPGQTAALSPSQAPMLLQSQDKQEELLRRLEQFAARVARLEAEVAQLEEKNKQLKAQLGGTNPFGGGAWVGGAPGSSVRVIQSGQAPGSPVIIQVEEKSEGKEERKSNPKNGAKER